MTQSKQPRKRLQRHPVALPATSYAYSALALAAAIAGTIAPAMAASTPSVSGDVERSLKQVPNPVLPVPPAKRTQDGTMPAETQSILGQVPIAAYQIQGADEHAPEIREAVRESVAGYVGQSITGPELQVLRQWLYDIYSKQAGLLATVEIILTGPETGRTLVVQVVAPKVRQLRIQSGDAIDKNLADAVHADLEGDLPAGKGLDLLRLENRLAEMALRYPADLRARIVGVAGGGIDIVIDVVQRDWTPLARRVAQVSLSNFGMPAYGRAQGSGYLALQGFTPGALIDGQVMASEGIQYGRLGYSLPVWQLGGRLQFSGSLLSTESTGGQASGRIKETSLDYTRMHYLARDLRWASGVGLTAKWAEDKAQDTEIAKNRLYSLHISQNLSRGPADDPSFGNLLRTGLRQSRWDIGMNLTAGRLDLSGNASNYAIDQQDGGPGKHGRYAKLGMTASGTWQLVAGQPVALSARLQAQAANKNLDAGEKFGIGGPSGVRGYSSAEGSGDAGGLASLALHAYPMAGMRVGPFVDVGWIKTNHRPFGVSSLPNSYSLRAAGVALDALVFGRVAISLAAAKSFGSATGLASTTETQPGDWRIWSTVSTQF